MKNLKSSAGILNRMVAVMKLGFMALSMVSVPVFVKPAFVASYEFVTAVFPRMLEAFSAWLTPTVLYVLVNCLILAILANSNLQRGFNITGSSYEEHNPSAARQKQREEAEEPVYEKESTERSGTANLEEEEPVYDKESTERSGTTELEEEEVSSAARSERIRTRDVRKVERPLATSRFNKLHRRSASAKSAMEVKSLDMSRPKEEESSLAATPLDSLRSEEQEASLDATSLDILESKEEAASLEATWKAITEAQRAPHKRHLRKSETFSSARNRTNNLLRGPEFPSGLKKEPSLSQDELNTRVEAFIAKVNNDMKLQREQSLLRYMEMVNRGSG